MYSWKKNLMLPSERGHRESAERFPQHHERWLMHSTAYPSTIRRSFFPVHLSAPPPITPAAAVDDVV